MRIFCIILGLICSISLQSQIFPKEEFRGVWVASVVNIDYPLVPTPDANALKKEWIKLLEEFKALNFNAVIVQIRPSGDALYPTDLAPWSAYLTGQQGVPPSPMFDPLDFMIRSAHERNIEFHAWLNPYRATMNLDTQSLSPQHQLFQHPEWFEQYGGKYYFNPALPAVQKHITDIVAEVVENYDVDAIHFDDYFYPYKVNNEEFPDEAEYSALGGTFTTKEAFREQAITQMIEMVSKKIKKIKPHVRFGISPFGVWRNDSNDVRGSDTKAGVRAYDDLHANIIKWLRKGLIDYIAPQLYWHIGFEPADYEELLEWWSEWKFGKQLYIGHAAYKIANDKNAQWHDVSEIPRQIQLNRNSFSIDGSIYFSASKIRNNPLNILEQLKFYYSNKVKLPAMVYLDVPTISAPTYDKPMADKEHIYLDWQEEKKAAYYYILYRFEGEFVGDMNNFDNVVMMTNFGKKLPSYTDENVEKGKIYTYALTAVNRVHVESLPRVITIKKKKKKAKVLY